jgi:trans-2,3-dihydro-3-hydroxyanthranilate isomerase
MQAVMIRVFLREYGAGGGNPVPLVAQAQGMTAAQMQAVAQRYGHESAFILPPADPVNTLRLRYFVPAHEMEMCGHATVGTLWALRQWGAWTSPEARIETASGIVHARWDAALGRAWITQPAVQVQPLDIAACRAVNDVLQSGPGVDATAGAAAGAAAGGRTATEPLAPMVNASTSRYKTLIPMPDVATLNGLTPKFSEVQALCDRIGSTGLYPYAVESVDSQGSVVHARQFPRSSGYPEDAATGIAAAALWGYLAGAGTIPVGTPAAPAAATVIQGVAMGSPSAIDLLPRFNPVGQVDGCWLSGAVEWITD